MRYKRTKKYKRAMNVYQTSFGFRLPFQCLVDGTMIVQSVAHKINIEESIPRTLTAETKLLVTPCIVSELMSLDKEEYGKAQWMARKKIQHRRCNHTEKLPARDCILDMVGKTNPHRFCVATHDTILRSKLRALPGIPIVHLKQSVMILEPPSAATLKESTRMERIKLMPEKLELKALKEDVTDENAKVKKKRKQKQPNSLSCLKKKSDSQSKTSNEASSSNAENNGKPRTKHRSRKKHSDNNNNLLDNTTQ